MDIQKKVDQRVKLIKDAQAFLDERDNGLTAEESTLFDAMMADADAIKAEINDAVAEEQVKANRVARIEAANADLEKIRSRGALDSLVATGGNVPQLPSSDHRGVSQSEAIAAAVDGLARHGHPRLMDEEAQAAAKAAGIGFNFDTGSPSLEIPLTARAPKSLDEIYAAQSTSNTAGGYTIPEGFVANLEKALLTYGSVRSMADVLRTASGNDLPWPTADDTGNVGALLGENATESEQDVTFGVFSLGAYKYTSKLLKTSIELLSDSNINLAAELGTMLGERIARIQNQHFTTGTGSSQPTGLTVGSATGVTAAGAAAITTDEILDLVASVDPAYRMGASFMMHDSTKTALLKLKNSNNDYIWRAGLEGAAPDTLLGYQVVINNDMPELATGNVTALFGNMGAYKVREVLNTSLVRLNERFADAHQVGWVAINRADGGLLTASATNTPVKHLVQA
jgi:HK97 family phage major capsid protein